MFYKSTRGHSGSLSFSDVLLEGLAPDGGLYMPESYPQLAWKDIEMMRDWSYNRIALHIIKLFVGNDVPENDLAAIIADAYTARKFHSLDITPIHPLGDRTGLLRLSNGPTLAFKDVGLQLLASLMEYVLERRDQSLTILGATSGDTGSAAEQAIRGKGRLRIFMLSPQSGMTEFQRRQMGTIDDRNVFNLSVAANFDDCQSAVKLVNMDAAFKDRHVIGAVNSINWARILAQVVYWVYGFVRTIHDSSEILTVSVPSGNFGNAFSAYVLGKMGLRIRIIVATNENDVLDRFFRTGEYRVRKGDQVRQTLSPSMDIASASNLERFAFDCVGRDPNRLVGLWQELTANGVFSLNLSETSIDEGPRFLSGSATNDETIEFMKIAFQKYRLVIDPHTAVAMKVGFERYSGNGLGPLLIAETAQAAKFDEAVFRALGTRFEVPPACRRLFRLPEKFLPIDASDPAAIAARVKEIIVENSR